MGSVALNQSKYTTTRRIKYFTENLNKTDTKHHLSKIQRKGFTSRIKGSSASISLTPTKAGTFVLIIMDSNIITDVRPHKNIGSAIGAWKQIQKTLL